MMKIYRLTQLGKKLARSTSNPDTEAWRIVHFLDKVDTSTPDQIASGAQLSPDRVAGTLASLKTRGIVQEIGGGYDQQRW